MARKYDNPFDYMMVEKTCAVCGKGICFYRGNEWAYYDRTRKGQAKIYYCSYSCELEAERRSEKAKLQKHPKATAFVPKSLEGLSRLRVAAGMSPSDLAKEIGVLTSTVYGYESGIYNPSRQTLNKLMDLFGVTLEELMDGGRK